MKNLDVVIQSIIVHQQDVVGPLAVEQANTVSGLRVEGSGKVKVTTKSDKEAVDLLVRLVKKYEQLFGQASVEVCKDAIKESGVTFNQKDLPDILK